MIKLFEEFKPVKKEEWISRATKDLKGKNPLEKFQKLFGDGIVQYPYYDLSDLNENNSFSVSHLVHNRPFNAWYNTEKIIIKTANEANRVALKALNSGATGIYFISTKEEIQLEVLLKDISLEYCYVCFEGFNGEVITQYLEKHYSNLEKVIQNISCVDTDFNNKLNPSVSNTLVKDISFQLTISETTTISTALSNILSQFVDLVSKLSGLEVNLLFSKIIIHNTCQNHYFFEIAKLRALRILFAEVGSYYGVESAKIFIQSETNLSTDELDNLLINTTQAMAAVTGGTDALIVNKHLMETSENANSDEFSRRIARNISNLLEEESHFDKVKDPAAGSYYLSNLTETIVNESWDKFKALEELGGYSKKFERIA